MGGAVDAYLEHRIPPQPPCLEGGPFPTPLATKNLRRAPRPHCWVSPRKVCLVQHAGSHKGLTGHFQEISRAGSEGGNSSPPSLLPPPTLPAATHIWPCAPPPRCSAHHPPRASPPLGQQALPPPRLVSAGLSPAWSSGRGFLALWHHSQGPSLGSPGSGIPITPRPKRQPPPVHPHAHQCFLHPVP